jgi:hypothetical protein
MDSDDTSTATTQISFSEPDLEVTVGTGETREVYMYHAVVMALWSEFIDRMLTSKMKESQTKKITFPDIVPSEWEAMVVYLEPGNGQRPHVDEAKRLAKWYDKYGFHSGLAMCDRVIRDFIKSDEYHDLGAKSDAFSLAFTYNLDRSQKGGTSFFAKLLRDPWQRSRLTLADISTFAPLIGRMDKLWVAVERIIPTIEGQVNRELLVQETCFPLLLHLAIQKEALVHVDVRVQGAGSDGANGIYIRDGACDGVLKFVKKGIWKGKEETFVLFRDGVPFKHWYIAIVPVGFQPGTDSDINFYFALASAQDTEYPPGQGWDNGEEYQGVLPAPVIAYQPARQG